MIAYVREHAGKRFACVHSLTGEAADVALPATGRVVLATDRKREGETVAGAVRLSGNDALIVELG